MAKHRAKSQNAKQSENNKLCNPESNPDSNNVTQVSSPPSFYLQLTIFFTSLVFYSNLSFTTVPSGDSAELLLAAHEFGIAHPPGYPLFTILAGISFRVYKIFQNILPFLHTSNQFTQIWFVIFTTCTIPQSLCNVFIYKISRQRFNTSDFSAIFGVLIFGLQKLVVKWSINAEVFPINNLCIALMAFYSLEKNDENRVKYGAFFSGLALTNQHTSVIYFLVYVILDLKFLWTSKPGFCGKIVYWAQIGLTMAIPLSIYLYLPISSFLFSDSRRYNWGEHESISGILTHVLRAEYGTFQLASSGEINILKNINFVFQHAISQFSFPVILIVVIGGFKSIKMKKPSVSLAVFVYLLFFCLRANLDVENKLFAGVVERFYLQSNLHFSVLGAVGTDSLNNIGLFKKNRQIAFSLQTGLLGFFLATSVYPVPSKNTVINDFAVEVFKSIPENSIVLLKGDLPSNSLRYKHLVDNFRKDLVLIDLEFMTYDWYKNSFRDVNSEKSVFFPNEVYHPYKENGYKMNEFIEHNRPKNVVTCTGLRDDDNVWPNNIDLHPLGFCQLAILKKEKFVYEVTPHAYQWNYLENPSQGRAFKSEVEEFAETDWEYLANREIWMAMEAVPLHYLKRADAENNWYLSKKSEELYSKLVEDVESKFGDIPINWRKNYGVACSRARNVTMGKEKNERLGKCIAKQFGIYLEHDNGKVDPQRSALETYVKQFSETVEE